MPTIDLPAYVCYAIVLALGLLTAIPAVRDRLESYPGYWQYLRTWLVFAALWLAPFFLFLFLSLTQAIHDTSLFAAVLVGGAYQQVATRGLGGIGGQADPSFLPGLIEKFTSRLAATIAKQHAASSQRAQDGLLNLLATEEPLKKLRRLVMEVSTSLPDVNRRIKALEDLEMEGLDDDTIKEVRGLRECKILLKEVRSKYEDYGGILRDRKLIGWLDYQWLFRDFRSRVTAGVVLIVLILFSILLFNTAPREVLWPKYHMWRLTKSEVSATDLGRTRGFFVKQVKALGPDSAVIVGRDMVRQLRSATLGPGATDRVVNLLMELREPSWDPVLVPILIDALWNENPDLRARVQNTLLGIRALDYSDSSLDEPTESWGGLESSSAVERERHLRAWTNWWTNVSGEEGN